MFVLRASGPCLRAIHRCLVDLLIQPFIDIRHNGGGYLYARLYNLLYREVAQKGEIQAEGIAVERNAN